MKKKLYFWEKSKYIFTPHKKDIILDFIVWLVLDSMPLLISLMLKNIFDSLQMGQMSDLFKFCLFAEITVVIQSVFIVMGGRIDTITRFNITKCITEKIINKRIKSRIKCGDNEQLVELLTNDVEAYSELISTEIDLVCKVIFAVSALMILLNISVSTTLMVALPVILITQIILRLSNLLQKSHIEKRSVDISYADIVGDIFTNREIIQYNSIQSCVLEEVQRNLTQRKKYNTRRSLIQALASEISDNEGFFSVSIVLFSLCLFSRRINLTAGDFSLIITLSAYIGQYNGLFEECVECVQNLKNTEKMIDEFFGEKVSSEVLDIERDKDDLESESEVNNISIKITLNGNPISFEASKGDFVVITGATGTGKSYLLDALLGYADSNVEIRANGKKVRFLSNVGVSLQKPSFINESVAENLMLGRKDEQIEGSLKIVNLDSELRKYMESEEKLGVNASLLSSGQRQRLAIARVLQSDSEIMIFDDSTNLIDRSNVQNILHFIYEITKQGKITIFISNRSDVTKYADKLIEVKQSR